MIEAAAFISLLISAKASLPTGRVVARMPRVYYDELGRGRARRLRSSRPGSGQYRSTEQSSANGHVAGGESPYLGRGGRCNNRH